MVNQWARSNVASVAGSIRRPFPDCFRENSTASKQF